MKLKFIIKLIIIFVLTNSAYLVYYYSINKEIKIEEDIDFYVWGDSQTAQGLDLDVLTNETKLEYFSMAIHGGGVYDFSCFANLVPKNSRVIIGYSSTIFLRPDSLDYNRTSLDWNSINKAWRSGYSISSIKNIILKNFRPNSGFPKNNRRRYVGINKQLGQKDEIRKLFLQGVKISEIRNKYFQFILDELIKKGCTIIIVQMPKSELLYEIESDISFSKSLEAIDEGIFSIMDKQVKLNLKFSKSDFYDVTHLNYQGGNKLSIKLAHFINSELKSKDQKLTFLIP